MATSTNTAIYSAKLVWGSWYSMDLPMCDRFELDNYLETIDFLSEKINNTQDRVEDFVKYNPQARLLMSIKGIDYYSALMISAEIGDVRRFNSAKKIISYAGLNFNIPIRR